MRNEYYDDYEQAEAVKKWLKENGLSIFTGIALGLGALFGWRFWEGYSADQRMSAARGFEQLVTDLDTGREATAEVLEAYRRQHDNPAFVGLAALELSHQAIEERNLDEAMRLLEAASKNAEPVEMRHVAGLRLARVQIQAGKLDEALATVGRFDDRGFQALAAEIRGDVLVAKGDREAAREAYGYALDNLKAGERALLQMKFDDLAPLDQVAAETPSASAPGSSSDDPASGLTAPPAVPVPTSSPAEAPAADGDAAEQSAGSGQESGP